MIWTHSNSVQNSVPGQKGCTPEWPSSCSSTNKHVPRTTDAVQVSSYVFKREPPDAPICNNAQQHSGIQAAIYDTPSEFKANLHSAESSTVSI